jgi:hypothetical protein
MPEVAAVITATLPSSFPISIHPFACTVRFGSARLSAANDSQLMETALNYTMKLCVE